MTIDEAKALTCPVMSGPVFVADDARIKISTKACIGPACMMWRWSKAERDKALDERFTAAIEAMGVVIDDPKSKPTPPQIKEAKAKAAEAMADFTPTRGDCGMKGEAS